MSERQANVRDEGTPATVPAQKQPTVAPDTDANSAPAVVMEGAETNDPQVRGKGPKGRERAASRRTKSPDRTAPAKPQGPNASRKAGGVKKGAVACAKRVAKKAGAKATARKGGTTKAGGKRPAAKRAGTQDALARKARKGPAKPAGDRKDSGGARPKKSAGKKAATIRGAVKKAGGRSATQGGRGGTAKGKRRNA